MLKSLCLTLALSLLGLGACQPNADTSPEPSAEASPSPTHDSSEIQLNRAFELQLGARAHKQNLTIVFEKVLEDSRCPEDVQCIWAGEVKVRLQVDTGGAVRRLDLTLPGEERAALDAGLELELLTVARPPEVLSLRLQKSSQPSPRPGDD